MVKPLIRITNCAKVRPLLVMQTRIICVMSGKVCKCRKSFPLVSNCYEFWSYILRPGVVLIVVAKAIYQKNLIDRFIPRKIPQE